VTIEILLHAYLSSFRNSGVSQFYKQTMLNNNE